jgi:tetratricopeptide (TPR) repeat protein
MKFPKTWWILVVMLLAAALRFGAALSFTRSPLCIHPVLEDAAYQARALAARHGELLPRELPRGSVLYPVLASLVPGLRTGGSAPLAAAQAGVEVATIALLVLWIRRRFGNAAGVLSGLLYALDPLGGFFAARFTPVAPATLLFVALLWLWDAERLRGRLDLPRSFVIASLATAGFFLAPLPFAGLAVARLLGALRARPGAAAAARPRSFARWASALLPLALPALVAAPLLLRHSRLPGGGPALGWGGGPAANRAFDPSTLGTPRYIAPPAWIPEEEWRAVAAEAAQRRLSDYELYRLYAKVGVGTALGQPFATLRVLLAKASAILSARPVADDLSPAFEARRHARLFAPLLWLFPLLLALASGGFVLHRGSPTAGVLAAGLIAAGATCLLGMASAASRQPALPLLAALSGAGIAAWFSGTARDLRKPALLAAGIALVLSLASAWIGPARIQRDPSEDLRLAATVFAQGKAWRQAVPLLEEAVRVAPANLEARLDLAEAYRNDALPAAAATQLETAYAADSTHARTIRALALDRAANNRLAEALSLFERLVSLHPNRASYLRELADLRGQAGDYPRAEALLQRAVRLDPEDEAAVEALQSVVRLRLQMENALFPDELRLAEDAKFDAAVPRLIEAMEQQRWRAADSLLIWMEQERPDRATTAWLRAGYFARRGDSRGAILALERCQRISPGRPAVVTQLVRLYDDTGAEAKIEPLLRSSLVAVGPDSVAARQLRAMMRQLGLR